MIQKILILAAVVAAVWYGFKYFTRVDQQRREKVSRERDAREGIADTVQCPVCQTYVAARGAVNCGKSGCPY
jgi:cytochrome c-type biogenesis protein CcmH/NrfF